MARDADIIRTADICDEFGDELLVCELALNDYAGRNHFHGEVRTFATYEDKSKINNVSFLITIDPLAFVSKEFYDREIAALVDYLHETPVRPGDPPVMIPGEYEARNQQEREAAGIEIEEPVWQAIQEAARALNVGVPAPVPGG